MSANLAWMAGMTKVSSPWANEALVLSTGGEMTQFFFEGERIKSAASDLFSRQKLAEFKPPKGKFGIHAILVGAEEQYGPNRNGDSFPKRALLDYGHTFVTHGHMFREHRNRDPKHAIGEIKAAAYHPDLHRQELIMWGDCEKAAKEYEAAKMGKQATYSMSCFPAGTLVRMLDGREKPIETVQPGEVVLTHHGRGHAVSHTMHRPFTGKGIELRAYGLAEPIRCTPDHGIWVRPKARATTPCPVCGGRFSSLQAHLRQKTDAKHQAAYRDFGRYCEGFAGAETLRPGDLVRTAFAKRAHDVAPPAHFPSLLGLYAAEGSLCIVQQKYQTNDGARTCPDHRTEFTFNIAELDLIEKAKDAVEAVTGKRPASFDYPEEHRTVVRSHSKELHDLLLEHGGKYSHAKQFSEWVMNWTPEALKELMEWWLAGDGNWHPENEVLKGTTVSRALMWQILEIAALNGLPGSVNSYKGNEKKRAYDISFRGNDAGQIHSSRKPDGWMPPAPTFRAVGHLKHQTPGQMSKTAVRTAQTMCFVEAGFVYRRIRTVKGVWLDEPVYDLTVPGDHGFMVHGYGVSNCRVPYDICNCCGFKAASVRDYCDDLRNHMLQWIPKFNKYAHAINDRPTFFDASDVGRQADRIAYGLEYFMPDNDMAKAASDAGRVVGGAELAEMMGVDLPVGEMLSPRDLASLQKLAAMEDLLDRIARKEGNDDSLRKFATQVALRDHAAFDHDAAFLEKIGKINPETLFHELAKRGCAMPFPLFVDYLNGKFNAEDPKVIKYASSLLPRTSNTLMLHAFANGNIVPALGRFKAAGADYADMDPGNNDDVQQAMEKMVEAVGTNPEQVRNRAAKDITDPQASASNPFAEQPDGESCKRAEVYSTLYALYKLAAFDEISRMHSNYNSDALALLLISQNR